MKRRTLLWKIYPYYLIIIISSLLFSAWYASKEMQELYIDEVTRTLESRAKLVRYSLTSAIAAGDAETLDRACKALGGLSATRITVVDSSGRVLGDSDEDPTVMENHAARPEIAQAFSGQTGTSTRFSATLQQSLIYVAIPVKAGESTVGIVRTSRPLTAAIHALNLLYLRLAIGALVVMVVATTISYFLFRRVSQPLIELQTSAREIARGRFEARPLVTDTQEIAAVSESMNRMAAELDARIRTIIQQRNERDAIFSSMSEGLLALDANECISSVNDAGARLLDIDVSGAVGRPLYEVVRVPILHNIVDQAMVGSDVAEAECALPGVGDRHVQFHAAALKDAAGERVGVVIVLNDVTRLMQLENIRSDFVANVSHELKTPITAISASVETLQDGALDSPTDRKRFIDIISRHAERLGLLVDDLLLLARLEREPEGEVLERSTVPLVRIIDSAIQASQTHLEKMSVTVQSECDRQLQVTVDATQIEQALINLIANAATHSEAGAIVSVSAGTVDDQVVIEVSDTGCGIAEEHLPRIFERFYRVDAARSRQTGGTGLGLAIVKHAARAHGGNVIVDSELGRGTTFRISLPPTSHPPQTS